MGVGNEKSLFIYLFILSKHCIHLLFGKAIEMIQ